MANLTPEPDTQDLLKRNVLGPAIFVLGAFIAVMMALDLYIGAGTGFVGDLARSIRDAIGLFPAFLAGAGTAWAGARLFLQDEPDDTLHHLAGWILVSLAMSLVLAPINRTWGGKLGFTGEWKVAGFFLGLAALFAPVWFFWLRDRFVLPDESEMPESLSQTLVDEGAAGISAEEADALLPVDDDSYQPARQNPELAKLLAKSLAGTAANQAIETKAPSPYPDDVRKSGGIPAGTVPIEVPRDADGNAAFAAGIEPVDEEVSTEAAPKPSTEDSSSPESVHRWAPKERRLAGQTLGEDSPQEAESSEKAPRKLQVNHSAATEATPIPQDARPIEDMVDIPPRPIWEAEEAGDDTAGAIADALFGDGPIGPVRTLPHDAPGAAETLAADAERVPEFSLEAPELEDEELEEEVAEWEEDEEDLDEDGEYAEADDLEEDELEDDEEYGDEEYEDDAAAELDEEELEDGEEYEEDEAAELEEDELEEDEEYEEGDDEDAEAAELEEDEEDEEYEEDDEEYEEEEAAELEEDEPEEGEEYEEDEAAELEEDELEEDEEYEEVAELEDEEPEEAAELEEEVASAESEVVLTPKAPPAPEPAAAKAKAVDAGGRVSPEIVYDAGVLFLERGRVAVSLLQREFSLDFDESCEVMDRLQKLGLIGPYVGGHRRDILLSREEWLEKATVG